MTLFELLGILALIGCGIAGAKVSVWLTGSHGWWSLPVGVAGFAVGIAATLGTIWTLWRLVAIVSPAVPRCAKAKCRPWKFKTEELVRIEQVKKDFKFASVLRCACGDLYAHVGDRFMRVGADGLWHPFRVRDPSGRWTEDTGPPLNPTVTSGQARQLEVPNADSGLPRA